MHITQTPELIRNVERGAVIIPNKNILQNGVPNEYNVMKIILIFIPPYMC